MQDFDNQKAKFTAEKLNDIFFHKIAIYTSSTSKHEISSLFQLFVDRFCPLGFGFGSSRPKPIGICIRNTGIIRTIRTMPFHLQRNTEHKVSTVPVRHLYLNPSFSLENSCML
jgi:hypothetical protein